MKHFTEMARNFFSNRSGLTSRLLYTFVWLIAFGIGFVAFFPAENLSQRLQQEINRHIPGTVTFADVGYSFPYSVKFYQTRIRLDDRDTPDLQFDSIRLTPHLASLLGRPGACFTARAQEGVITGSVTRAGTFSLEIENFTFDEPVQGFSTLRLSATVKSGTLLSHTAPEPDSPTILTAEVENISLRGTASAGLTVDQLNLGQLTIGVKGTGRQLRIERARLTGGDVTAEASGRINIGRSIPASRMNLDLFVKPSPALDPSVGSLLQLVGTAGPDGSRKVSLSGALATPRLR